MALTNFLTLYSGLDTAKGGTSIGETRRIPVTAPHELLLSRIPRCSATSTSVLDNAFTTIAALRGECSVTIGGAPATIISGTTPTASGEVAFQIVQGDQWRFSPKVTFHSSDAGKTAVFTYSGFMSNADSRYLDQIQDAVNRLEELPPCGLLSLNTYDAGAFLNGTANDASVYVSPSRGALDTSNGMQVWPGGTCDFSAGDTQVSAFSDVDGYKSISVYLYDNAGTFALAITESAEGAVRPATPTVTARAEGGWLCGAVIVQGDGTGSAGGIEPVTQADCLSLWNIAGGGSAALYPLSFATWGNLVASEWVDVPAVVPVTATLTQIDLYISESGSANATRADVQIKTPGGSSWVSLFDSTSDMPTVSNGADDGTDSAVAADVNTTDLLAGTRVRAVWNAVATGASIGRVTVWLREV